MAKDFLKQVIRFPGKLLLASLLLLPGLVLAEAPVAPFKQTFVLSSTGVPFSIAAERRLKVDANGIWHMSVSADNWLGEITESTAFSWQSCVPQSSQYRYKRVGLGKEKYAVVAFDQAAGEAHVRRDDRRKSYPITGTTTDKLSQTLALQCMLSRGDMALELDIADESGLDRIRYRRVGEEILNTPAGKFSTVKIERVREAGNDRETLMWFATDQQYALVQMVQREDDKTHTLVIRNLSD